MPGNVENALILFYFPSQRDGSLLASDSGVCDYRVSVAVSPKVSPSIDQRNRFASVRALRRFQQRSSAFPKPVSSGLELLHASVCRLVFLLGLCHHVLLNSCEGFDIGQGIGY